MDLFEILNAQVCRQTAMQYLILDSPLAALSPASVSTPGSLWAAVGLVMGTAVGPGILGLPAAALPAGLVPSTVAIVAAWAYVVASVLLVAEATIQVMQETGAKEVGARAQSEIGAVGLVSSGGKACKHVVNKWPQ